MSSEAKAVIEEFARLQRRDQLTVFEAIARKMTPVDYGPLLNGDLTRIAAESFALLDNEERRAKS